MGKTVTVCQEHGPEFIDAVGRCLQCVEDEDIHRHAEEAMAEALKPENMLELIRDLAARVKVLEGDFT